MTPRMPVFDPGNRFRVFLKIATWSTEGAGKRGYLSCLIAVHHFTLGRHPTCEGIGCVSPKQGRGGPATSRVVGLESRVL
jgi:hypothetical protein